MILIYNLLTILMKISYHWQRQVLFPFHCYLVIRNLEPLDRVHKFAGYATRV